MSQTFQSKPRKLTPEQLDQVVGGDGSTTQGPPLPPPAKTTGGVDNQAKNFG